MASNKIIEHRKKMVAVVAKRLKGFNVENSTAEAEKLERIVYASCGGKVDNVYQRQMQQRMARMVSEKLYEQLKSFSETIKTSYIPRTRYINNTQLLKHWTVIARKIDQLRPLDNMSTQTSERVREMVNLQKAYKLSQDRLRQALKEAQEMDSKARTYKGGLNKFVDLLKENKGQLVESGKSLVPIISKIFMHPRDRYLKQQGKKQNLLSAASSSAHGRASIKGPTHGKMAVNPSSVSAQNSNRFPATSPGLPTSQVGLAPVQQTLIQTQQAQAQAQAQQLLFGRPQGNLSKATTAAAPASLTMSIPAQSANSAATPTAIQLQQLAAMAKIPLKNLQLNRLTQQEQYRFAMALQAQAQAQAQAQQVVQQAQQKKQAQQSQTQQAQAMYTQSATEQLRQLPVAIDLEFKKIQQENKNFQLQRKWLAFSGSGLKAQFTMEKKVPILIVNFPPDYHINKSQNLSFELKQGESPFTEDRHIPPMKQQIPHFLSSKGLPLRLGPLIKILHQYVEQAFQQQAQRRRNTV
eukprot:CAMPEP_0114535882 /NCGR_PEP_ID=MMETSP0109-20121206/28678_1 /TAXON_ID=29199 /ORGANISM="Chlorarachnion reptans, Strain CCCM449" /LENGTH=522 /DNA_ID=CAMNT_0001719527 /DNA_START=155 /DNA_END=1723 /DNA_ORIENTATION=-